MASSSTSLRWLTLAVLLPLLVLGVLAWLGTLAQVRAAWSSARDEAKLAAEIAAESIARDLAAAVMTVPVFPDPPIPGEASPVDAVLDGTDPDALRQLRDDRDAGLSPSGLPRQVLAGFRVYEISGDAADGAALVDVATTGAPSVLTPVVFRTVGGLAGDWSDRWKRAAAARQVAQRHQELGQEGQWIADGGESWWLQVGDNQVRAIDPQALAEVLMTAGKRLPGWAGLRFSTAGGNLAGQEVMARVPVKFSGDPMVEILAAKPALFEAAASQQARWTVGLLAFAVAVSGGALVFIHRAVERERRLNALKSDFVASVSHELRAPVASIRLMADALDAGKIEPATARDFHRLISREGARLSTLIENVLDFARIEQGRKQWHFETADLGALVAEAVGLMEPLAKEKSITLVPAQPSPAASVRVDPGAIQQAVVNLLDNAIKFSPAGSRVEISLDQRDAIWEIRIADQGPGVPPAEQQRVFEKFHRLGNELRRETQGTGIGLSLVKAVAEAHGGRVLLESAPGQGSVFTLMGTVS